MGDEDFDIERRKRKLQEIREKALKGQAKIASLTAPEEKSKVARKNENDKQKEDVEVVKTEDVIKAELQSLQSEEVNIAPRKINWDLKKHIEPKLEKLRKRTQKAIVEILREKLRNSDE